MQHNVYKMVIIKAYHSILRCWSEQYMSCKSYLNVCLIDAKYLLAPLRLHGLRLEEEI